MATREYRRRHIVRTAGLVAVAGAAGCLDDEGDAVEPGDDETDAPADDDTGGGDDIDESDDGGDDAGTDDAEGEETGGDAATEDDTETDDGGATDDASDADDAERTDDDTDDGGDVDDVADDGHDADEDPGEDADDSTEEPEDDGEGTIDAPDGFVTYTNEELGYAITHPEDWEVDEGGEEVYIGDPGGNRELGILAFDAADYADVEALTAEFLAGLEADYEDVEVREEGDRVLESGQDARLLDIAYVNPDDDRGRRRSRMLFAIDPGTDAGYVAEVASSAEAFDDAFEARADTMLASFRLVDGDGVERVGWFAPASLAGSGTEGMAAGQFYSSQ